MSMQGFVEGTKKCVVIISVAGVAFYALALLAYALGFAPAELLLKTGKPSYMFGLPISGAIAFAIVCLLDTIAPATKDASGNIEFKAFGLAFSGPAGPITLWIACYLTLIASMQIVS